MSATSLNLREQTVALLGFDSSVAPLVQFLLKQKANVRVLDSRTAEQLQKGLDESKINIESVDLQLGELSAKSFEGVQVLIATQYGLRYLTRAIEVAQSMGIAAMSEVEFVSQNIDEESLICVVGTSGKSMTAHILKTMLDLHGVNTFANIDAPLAGVLNLAKAPEKVIAIIDTLQLELVQTLQPKLVIMGDASPDYLDRYQTPERYLAALKQLFKNSTENTLFVSNPNDATIVNMVQDVPGRFIPFSANELSGADIGAWYNKNSVTFKTPELGTHTLDMTQCRLRGPANKENLIIAGLAFLLLGGKVEEITKTIAEIRTLPGRLEFVKRSNFVAFYNDVSATNPNAVARSLHAFYEPVILISGGRDRNMDYTIMGPHIRQKVKNVILVGEAKEKMNRMIGDFTETFLVGTYEEAVLFAYQKARSGDVILLSSGCEPTDQFATDAEKSNYFKELVTQITQPRRQTIVI